MSELPRPLIIAAFGVIGLVAMIACVWLFAVADVMQRRGGCVMYTAGSPTECRQRIPLKW